MLRQQRTAWGGHRAGHVLKSAAHAITRCSSIVLMADKRVARLDTLSINTPLTTAVFENRQIAGGIEFAFPTPPVRGPCVARGFRKSRANSNEHADGEIGALARISSAATNCGRSPNVTLFAFRNAHMRIQNPPVSKKVPIDWSRDHSAACQLTRVMWPLRARGNNGLGGIILRTMPEAGVRCSFREALLPP
jgi:hypothetical protein